MIFTVFFPGTWVAMRDEWEVKAWLIERRYGWMSIRTNKRTGLVTVSAYKVVPPPL